MTQDHRKRKTHFYTLYNRLNLFTGHRPQVGAVQFGGLVLAGERGQRGGGKVPEEERPPRPRPPQGRPAGRTGQHYVSLQLNINRKTYQAHI